VLPLFSCRVRAGTACRSLGPCTAHASCRAGTDTTSIVSCRVRVVFFSVVRRAARRVWPIWPSILGSTQKMELAPPRTCLAIVSALHPAPARRRGIHLWPPRVQCRAPSSGRAQGDERVVASRPPGLPRGRAGGGVSTRGPRPSSRGRVGEHAAPVDRCGEWGMAASTAVVPSPVGAAAGSGARRSRRRSWPWPRPLLWALESAVAAGKKGTAAQLQPKKMETPLSCEPRGEGKRVWVSLF
jgi:hypothetical protein